MAAVLHLGIAVSSYEVFSLGHISVSNFMQIRMQISDVNFMAIWIFLQIWLEIPIHAPKISVLGPEPINVIGHHRDPQKAHPWPEPRLHANYGTLSVRWRDLGACSRNQKERKKEKGKDRNLQWQTGCSPRPPTLTQRYVVLQARWSSGGSYKFQVSSKSVERFSRCVMCGSKFAISIPKASGL